MSKNQKEFANKTLSKFVIQGKTLIVKPLTVGQVKKLLELFSELDVEQNSAFNQLVDFLLDKKLVQLMSIIFAGQEADKINWLDVPYETVDEIAQVFFLKNPRLINRLKNLFATLVQVDQTTIP